MISRALISQISGTLKHGYFSLANDKPSFLKNRGAVNKLGRTLTNCQWEIDWTKNKNDKLNLKKHIKRKL